ncbi:MAG: response regulator [Anaerolineae bacterium]|nr:response regulator [Anaerolineae bacterium]MCI0610044.1 response regulator [Anaerolineae bacterium]
MLQTHQQNTRLKISRYNGIATRVTEVFNSGQGKLKHMMNENYSDKKPVLIVEDNPVNRDLFSLQLRHFGLSTQHAANGKEAVEWIHADPDAFSFVLMDLQMPVMDGITATHLIRQNESNTNRHIIIVALTANDSAGIQDQCMEAGMDDFVHKPSTLAKISYILSKWLKDS